MNNSNIENISSAIKGKLVVSCQALRDEPLHSSYIMGRMAVAAVEGGACGIRANSIEDIIEIKKNVSVPIIGIIKRIFQDSDVYITPTMNEVDALVQVGTEIIAIDATTRIRPNGIMIDAFFGQIKKSYPNQALMADCSTLDEMQNAGKLGFDFIGTTLVGYTESSKSMRIEASDFEIIRSALQKTTTPIIAEGNIDTPQKASRVLQLGCHSVVVGSAITRPQLITGKFVDAIIQTQEH